MSTDPALFSPLLAHVRIELARQVDGEVDAGRLRAVGFGPELSVVLAGQLSTGIGNVPKLEAFGISAPLARRLVDAMAARRGSL